MQCDFRSSGIVLIMLKSLCEVRKSFCIILCFQQHNEAEREVKEDHFGVDILIDVAFGEPQFVHDADHIFVVYERVESGGELSFLA